MSAPRGPRSRGAGKGSRNSESTPIKSAMRRSSAASNGRVSSAPSAKLNGSNARPRPNSSQAAQSTAGRRPPPPKAASAGGLSTISTLPASRDPTRADRAQYESEMGDLFQKAKDNRERERKAAIRNGFLADPDKPTSLADAITPVGTCQDMCPEFERVERIVQKLVDGWEKKSSPNSDTKVPWEEFMVKRFRRSAAGTDDQIPSDIRPPSVLKKTLDYLLDQVVGGPEPLAAVHKFVWDRTRGIRNDFSIQQVSKVEDLKIAIECFEQIARFHLLSLHQLSHPTRNNGDFDPHQEREQLNNTLLSLMYYYDDSRQKLVSANEAEFRAYCIIFEIQDQRPDLEDRAQSWPKQLIRDAKVQTALKLYAAAGSTSDDQGPLRPRIPFSIAQANFGRFWSLLRSPSVSYLGACAAEIYFNLVRGNALETIWKAYRRPSSAKLDDLTLDEVTKSLGFDTEEQTQRYCEEHGFTVGEREDGNAFLDLSSVSGRWLTDSNSSRRQLFSRTIVEAKRHNRTLAATIRGYSVAHCRSQGLLEDASDLDDSQDENLFVSDEEESTAEENAGAQLPQSSASGIPNGNAPNPFGNTPISFPESAGKAQFNPFAAATAASGAAPVTPIVATPAINPSNGFPSQAASFGNPNPFTKAFEISSSSSVPPVANPFASKPSFSSEKPQLSNQEIASSVFGNKSTATHPAFGSEQKPGLQPTMGFGSGSERNSSDLFSNFKIPPKAQPQESKSLDTKPEAPNVSGFSVTPQDNTDKIQQSHKAPWQPQPSKSSLFPTIAPTPPQPSFLHNQNTAPKNPSPLFQFSTPAPQELPRSGPEASSQNQKLSMPQVSAEQSFMPSIPPPQQPKANLLDLFSTASSVASSAESDATARKNPPPPKGFQPSKAPTQPSTAPSVSQATQPLPAKQMKPDPRPKALSKLSDEVTFGDRGILEMFVESILDPIIEKSLRKLAREQEKARVAEARAILLATKYFRRWRENAWKKYLSRRGRERRKNLAQSMQMLASGSQASTDKTHSPGALANLLTASQSAKDPLDEGPLSTVPVRKKRESLPAQIGTKTHRADSKQEQQHFPQARSESPAKRHKTSQHQRSQTVGGLSASVPQQQNARRGHRASPFGSSLNGSMNDSLMRKARRLVTGRSDTTKTDYFRLKAMGLDPDTPTVPQTRKRVRVSDGEDVLTNDSRSPPSLTRPSSKATHTAVAAPLSTTKSLVRASQDAEDEELFERVRRVREAMAESESWFREEREKEARSQSVTSEKQSMTEKERRLHEFQYTPSRTSIRLQKTNAHGLLARDYKSKGQGVEGGGDGNPFGDSTRPKSSSATEASGSFFGNGNVDGMAPNGTNAIGKNAPWYSEGTMDGKGASMDDAIEL